MTTRTKGRTRRLTGRVLLLSGLALFANGCSIDDLMEAPDPDLILPEDLETPQGLDALYGGAISDFQVAHDGEFGIVSASGLLVDEFIWAGPGVESVEMDLRQIREQSVAYFETFHDLHRARASGLRAARRIRELGDDPESDSRIGEAYALAATVHNLFGEGYCSGIPFSSFEEGTEYGLPRTTEEILQEAVALADSARSFSGGSEVVQHLAALAHGRALLNLGEVGNAAEAVREVPTSFSYETFHSTATGRQQNGLWSLTWNSRDVSVADREGDNGLDFGTAEDPRLVVEEAGLSFDETVQVYLPEKYGSATSSVVVASGIEARLIEAEAELRAGATDAWLEILNELRDLERVDALVDPGSQEERVDLHFRERAFWLFGTAHRLGDLRRMIRQYDRDAESLYPTGRFHKPGLQYGDAVVIPVPEPERNNPNFDGCLDLGA